LSALSSLILRRSMRFISFWRFWKVVAIVSPYSRVRPESGRSARNARTALVRIAGVPAEFLAEVLAIDARGWLTTGPILAALCCKEKLWQRLSKSAKKK